MRLSRHLGATAAALALFTMPVLAADNAAPVKNERAMDASTGRSASETTTPKSERAMSPDSAKDGSSPNPKSERAIGSDKTPR